MVFKKESEGQSGFNEWMRIEVQPVRANLINLGGAIMKKSILVVFTIAMVGLLWCGFADAQSWYDPGWLYRRAVTISNPSLSALTDYQVQITLDSSFDFGNAKSDGSDIRVTPGDGTTLIPFWIETWTPASQQGSIWVKVPTISTSGTIVFLYYGNPNPVDPPVEGPPTGPFTRSPGNPIRPIGDPGNGVGLLAENIVYDNVTGHYWMVFANYRDPGWVWSGRTPQPTRPLGTGTGMCMITQGVVTVHLPLTW